MSDEIYVDTYGQVITVETGVDISGAATSKLVVKYPSGATADWQSTPSGTSDTQLIYTTASGDLDEVGTYLIQSYVEWEGNSVHRGKPDRLEVYANFEPEV